MENTPRKRVIKSVTYKTKEGLRTETLGILSYDCSPEEVSKLLASIHREVSQQLELRFNLFDWTAHLLFCTTCSANEPLDVFQQLFCKEALQ